MMTVGLTLVCLLSGSLMFSYWIGILRKVNLHAVGDGNPGGFNLWKGAGFQFGLAGIALDFLKGYLPVFLIVSTGVLSGYQLISVALAPIIGHAFSPFLRFNGGKSLAVSFGIWSALTQFRASISYAVILASLYVILWVFKRGKKTSSNEDGIQTTLGFLLLFIYLLNKNYSSPILWIWLGNFIILAWKNRSGMIQVFKDKVQRGERHFPA